MRLFGYYALHSIFNQFRKLFKTWVLVFILVCALFGGLIGFGAAKLEEAASGDEPYQETEVIEDQEPAAEEPDFSFEEATGISGIAAVEIAASVIVLAVFAYEVCSAQSQGGKIFLPADVNLLFASPMKPQSVMMFRLATQLGMAVAGSLYLLFQIPNLTLNLGVPVWTALSLIAAWCITLITGKLLQLTVYCTGSIYPFVKENVHKAVYVLIAVILAVFGLYYVRSAEGWLSAASGFFSAKWTFWIPFWGWIRGFVFYALEGNPLMSLLFLAVNTAGSAALMWLIWHLDVDFYEDAMTKSQEVAELMEAAQSDRRSLSVRTGKKERSERIERDGFHYGSGANVYFFKTLYNRFRFAHLKYFTATSETYLAVGILSALLLRFAIGTDSFTPIALILAVFVFFRTLGNPLNADAQLDWFMLVPDPAWKKLFFSLLGGSVNCLLDLLPGMIAGALIIGANPFKALLWLPLIVSVDFYGTNVGTFLDLSIPLSIGKTIKQTIQIMFLYFGLIPDIAMLAIGFAMGYEVPAEIICTLVNFFLGMLFLGLSAVFTEPCGGREIETDGTETVSPAAKKSFSLIGLSASLILAVTVILQLGLSLMLKNSMPADFSGWTLWLITFAPMYLLAVPAGIMMMKRIPAEKLPQKKLRMKYFIILPMICVFLVYCGNVIGILINAVLGSLFPVTAELPLEQMTMEGSLIQRILFMVILAPVIEEYIFRRQMIDRLHIYGGRTAVIVSGIMFGLFHGNFSQFFYAAALGIVFGYVYLKTGKLRYTIALHMFVNFFGGIAGPQIMENLAGIANHIDQLAVLSPLKLLTLPQVVIFFLYIVVLIAMFLGGFVMLVQQMREVSFAKEAEQLPKGSAAAVSWANPGMILFVLLCIGMFIVSFI